MIETKPNSYNHKLARDSNWKSEAHCICISLISQKGKHTCEWGIFPLWHQFRPFVFMLLVVSVLIIKFWELMVWAALPHPKKKLQIHIAAKMKAIKE